MSTLFYPLRRHSCRPGVFAFILIGASCVAYVACDNDSAIKESAPDSGASSSGTASGNPSDGGGSSSGGDAGDGGPKDCFDNPKTHFEIINACTNATKITKNPTLTKLLPDGGLPPLQ